jgi:hypothetical protein
VVPIVPEEWERMLLFERAGGVNGYESLSPRSKGQRIAKLQFPVPCRAAPRLDLDLLNRENKKWEKALASSRCSG